MLARTSIGTKLALAFAALAAVTIVVVLFSLLVGSGVTRDITLSESQRLPGSLTSARAQASLLNMQLHLRGYLVLGNRHDADQFQFHKREFESGLAALQQLARGWDIEDDRQVDQLSRDYAQWIELPQKLFVLHDNPLKNQPALRLARAEVQPRKVEVLDRIDSIITVQKGRTLTPYQRELLTALVAFQTSFDGTVTNLIAYAASGEPAFRLAYDPLLTANAALWKELSAKRSQLTAGQRKDLAVIAARRAEIGELAGRIGNIVPSERAYEDLYLYRSEAEPKAQGMLRALAALTARQQSGLQSALGHARERLDSARLPAVLGGMFAVGLAIALAVIAQWQVVRPMRRLTALAEQVAPGDRPALDETQSQDEIGRLTQMIATRLRKDELQQLMASVSDALWSADIGSDGTFACRYYSPVVERIAGLPPEYFLESPQRWLDIVHPEDRPALGARVERIVSGHCDRDDSEYRIVRPDGTVRWVRDSVRARRLADGRIVLNGVVSDITERRCIEEELRARQDMLDLAQRAAHAAAFEVRITAAGVAHPRWSPDLEAMHGLAPGAYGGTYEAWKKLVHPDDWPAVKAAMKRSNETGDFAFEYRVVHPNGAVVWLQVKGKKSFDDEGRPTRIVGFMLDVTERHQAEEDLRRLEKQLRQAQRLEAMGTLAGGIAHDFNNILGAILGYGEMALREAPRTGRLRRDLDNILVAGERGRALVDRILVFSRSGVGERVAVHVQEVVREALELIGKTLPARIRLQTRLDAERAVMLGDPAQAHQVMMNLASNAIQAMPRGGTLSVSLHVAVFDAAHAATTGLLAAGEYIVLTVQDSGVGIAADAMERIFDPFFTTKDVGVGTGLGLSLVHGIVSEAGGALDVQSTPGMGSVFSVYLPCAGDVVDGETAGDWDGLPRGQGQRVLVVDDEVALARLAQENLTELGYTPQAFSSSTAALQALREAPERYDAVITDERMPDMPGTALIREIRRLRTDIPVLLVSGYAGPDLSSRAREAGADAVLKKPLALRDMATTLARELARR